MTTEALLRDEPAEEEAATQRTLPIAALAWVGISAAFVVLRLGAIWHAPVGGVELIHLSGAWQARVGVADDRFVPTLFQALTALLLHLSDSEIPARVVAFLATATIPAAFWFLRPRLGQAGALVALLLLAFDGPGLSLGVSASAMGFDLALAAWLFVAVTALRLPYWGWGIAGFLLATAGPIPMVAAVPALGVALARRFLPPKKAVAWCCAGVAAGILAATFGFGLGLHGGLRMPPFELFAASFDQAWSTPTTLAVVVLYSWPILLAGAIAGLVVGRRLWLARDSDEGEMLLLAWAALALAWVLISSSASSPVPVVAASLPMAILAGPALARAFDAMLSADWTRARFLIPAALFAAAVALVFMLTWARNGQATDNGEKVLVTALLVFAAFSLGAAAWRREAFPALLAPALVVAGPLLISGGFGIAFNSAGETLPSPISPPQARQLRDTVLQLAHERGGLVVVNDRYADAMTWPFRESGNLVVASRVPADAAVVVWPADATGPQGYDTVPGDWNFEVAPSPPTGGFLDYLKWLSDRGALPVDRVSAALYVKAKP